MGKAEAFTKLYPLTPGAEKLFESVLTGIEEPIQVSRAMIERLKEQAAKAGFQFLAVAKIDNFILRIYFRTQDGLYIKDLPLNSEDPSRELFLHMLAYDYQPDLWAYEEDYFVDMKPHRPN